MKMYSIKFGYTGSANVMAESKEKAFDLLKSCAYGETLTIDDVYEFNENEVDVNCGDE